MKKKVLHRVGSSYIGLYNDASIIPKNKTFLKIVWGDIFLSTTLFTKLRHVKPFFVGRITVTVVVS